MKKPCHYAFLSAGTLAFCALSSGLASAQDPGTSMPTPPPAQTPSTLAGPNAPLEVAPVATTSVVQEPVIDAATTRRTLPNRPLLVTGLVVLGGSYGAAAIVGAISDREADEKLFYPVVGPWLDVNHRGCAANPCDNRTLDRVLLVGDGVLQGIGALSVLMSVMIPERTTRNWYLIGNRDLVVAPQLGTRTTGLMAAGRF